MDNQIRRFMFIAIYSFSCYNYAGWNILIESRDGGFFTYLFGLSGLVTYSWYLEYSFVGSITALECPLLSSGAKRDHEQFHC